MHAKKLHQNEDSWTQTLIISSHTVGAPYFVISEPANHTK